LFSARHGLAAALRLARAASPSIFKAFIIKFRGLKWPSFIIPRRQIARRSFSLPRKAAVLS
jgi:hypothetical protein